MSSITTAQAAGFSIGSVPGRYYLDKRPTDQLYDILPFIPIEGHELVLNVIDAEQPARREKSQPLRAFVALFAGPDVDEKTAFGLDGQRAGAPLWWLKGLSL